MTNPATMATTAASGSLPNLRFEVLVLEIVPQYKYYRYIVEGPNTDASSPQQVIFTDEEHVVTQDQSSPHPDITLANVNVAITQPTGVVYATKLQDTDTRPSDYIVDEAGNPV